MNRILYWLTILGLAILIIIGGVFYINYSTDAYLKSIVENLGIQAEIRSNGHFTFSCIEGKLFNHTFHCYPLHEHRTDYTRLELDFDFDKNFILEVHLARAGYKTSLHTFSTGNPSFDELFVIYTNQLHTAEKIIDTEVQKALLKNHDLVYHSIYIKKNKLSCKLERHFFDGASIKDLKNTMPIIQRISQNMDNL